jgi:trigger factor
LDIQLQKKSPVEGIITIQVKESDYASIVEEKIREYSKNSRMKGFRPGHIPLSLIKKLYGIDVLTETVYTLLSNQLTNYLQKSNIAILGEPLPEEEEMQKIDWATQREFEFRYSIGLVEETDLALSKDWQVTAYKIDQVADETIDRITQDLSKAQGEKQEVNQSALGDIISGELSHQQHRMVKEIRFSLEESKAKVDNVLLNLQPTDKITLDINELLQQGIRPLGLTDKMLHEWMAMEGPFEFTVLKIERPIPAELNQALFDKILGEDVVSSLEEFRSKLQEYTIRNKQQEADHLLEGAIKSALLAHITINLPEDFLKRWLQYKHTSLEIEEIEAYYQHYDQDLRWELVLKKIIEAYDLQVSPDSVIEEIKRRFQSLYHIPEETLDQLVKTFLQENKGDNYKRIHQELLVDKVFNCVKEQITIVTQAMSVEEFDKLAQ